MKKNMQPFSKVHFYTHLCLPLITLFLHAYNNIFSGQDTGCSIHTEGICRLELRLPDQPLGNSMNFYPLTRFTTAKGT